MLWTDERIGNEFAPVGVADYAGNSYDLAVTTANRMRDEYEAALVAQAAEIERLRAENAQIAAWGRVSLRWFDTYFAKAPKFVADAPEAVKVHP